MALSIPLHNVASAYRACQKTITLILAFAAVIVWSYIVGALYGPLIDDKSSSPCDDIIQYPSGAIVCEVNMNNINDRVIIYKE